MVLTPCHWAVPPLSFSFLRHELGKARSLRKVPLVVPSFKNFGFKIALLDDHVAALKPVFGTLSMILVSSVLLPRYSCLMLVTHGQSAGESITWCGMKVGPARVKRGTVRYLNTIACESWELL